MQYLSAFWRLSAGLLPEKQCQESRIEILGEIQPGSPDGLTSPRRHHPRLRAEPGADFIEALGLVGSWRPSPPRMAMTARSLTNLSRKSTISPFPNIRVVIQEFEMCNSFQYLVCL